MPAQDRIVAGVFRLVNQRSRLARLTPTDPNEESGTCRVRRGGTSEWSHDLFEWIASALPREIPDVRVLHGHFVDGIYEPFQNSISAQSDPRIGATVPIAGPANEAQRRSTALSTG